jgi:hypothetical protein
MMMFKSLEAIGFGAGALGPAADVVRQLAETAVEVVETEAGFYKVCRLAGGAEVWLHIGPPGGVQAGRIVGITPFHSAEGTVRVRIVDIVNAGESDRMAGAYLCYLPAQMRGDRELGIALEMIPFTRRLGAVVSQLRDVQVLALASEAAVYHSVREFLSTVPKDRLVSPGAIAPLLVAGGADRHFATTGQMRCLALVTGLVRQGRRVVNPLSGQPYWWLRIDTDRGPFNVVVHEAQLNGKALVAGAVLQVKARLVGRDVGSPAGVLGADAGAMKAAE